MQSEIDSLLGPRVSLSHKSWISYIPIAIGGPLMLCLSLLGIVISPLFGPLVVIGVALLIWYSVLETKSFHLYYDDTSVWLSCGVLPWKRATYGVKWRDISEATYELGFFSWLFNSYTVRVGHRFTNDKEIVLRNMRNGKDAAAIINGRLMELAKSNKLS